MNDSGPIPSEAWRSAYLVAFNTLCHLRDLLAASPPERVNLLYLLAMIEHALLQCEEHILRTGDKPGT